MAVYVDDMRAKYGQMIMCHMTADSTDELLQMADRIRVKRKWIQNAGHPTREHFDICLTKRALAVQLGAVEVTQRDMAKQRIHRKEGIL
jgi:GMP synthase-like glutamine amidotransferase